MNRKNGHCVNYRMSISTLAKLTLFGLAFIYTAKLVDTFYHGIFDHVAAAGAVVGLNILTGVIQLVFFIFLFQHSMTVKKPTLKMAARLAITGSFLALIPKLLAMVILFQPEPLFFFIHHGTKIAVFCPLLASMLLLTFSLIFFFDYRFSPDKALRNAFAAGAAGWFIMAAAQFLVVVNFLSGAPVWLAKLLYAGPIAYVTASSLSFLALSILYLTFACSKYERQQGVVIPQNSIPHTHGKI